MILRDFKVFNMSGRLLGLDWGAHRTGVAISDAERKFVFARDPIVATDADDLIGKIIGLINQENIAGIVVGLPLRMDGTDSDTTAMVRGFADNLSHHTELPIIFIDETLSSASAQEQMGRIRVRDIKEKLDSNAARVILENAIALMNR
jgi:putative Holliday junction resolvase